jgi:hypothetical protein
MSAEAKCGVHCSSRSAAEQYPLVLAALPDPLLETALPGEHDRAEDRGRRITPRLVLVKQSPRGHVRLAGLLAFEVRKRHAAMIAAPVASPRTVLSGRLVPASQPVAPVRA